MSNEDSMSESQSHQSAPPDAGSAAGREEILAANMPVQERHQPDPVLQLSVGRLGAGAVALAAVVAAVILAVVLYGLNSPPPNAQHVGAAKTAAAAPAAPGTPPAGKPSAAGAPHGNSGHS